jgi:hypothetical protein
MRDHSATLPHLAFIKRRSVYRDQHLRSQINQLVRGVVCVEAFSPECLVVPEVFTDSNTQFAAVDSKQLALARRFEIARIIEDVVFRQQGLVGKPE